jgi:hypothetical protein
MRNRATDSLIGNRFFTFRAYSAIIR